MEKEICECKRDYKSPLSGICELCWDEKYPDEKETLGEAADKANGYNLYAKETKAPIFNEGFFEGAKWQAKRMYSEEEVREAIRLAQFNDNGAIIPMTEEEIILQFKKK